MYKLGETVGSTAADGTARVGLAPLASQSNREDSQRNRALNHMGAMVLPSNKLEISVKFYNLST